MGGVKNLCVNSAYFTDASTLAKLLRCAPQVTNLYIIRGWVDIHDLARLQQLRRLEMISCSIVGSPPSSLLRLPHLRRLAIHNYPLGDSALLLLTPAFLPQLRHLDFDNFRTVAPLIPQLEIVNCVSGRFDYTLLSRAKSLLLLPLPHYAHERLDMLAKLPSLPPFLHIHVPPYALGGYLETDLVQALEDLLKTKKSGLRVILLNDYEIDDGIRSLFQRFEERGVRVQLVDEELDFEGAVIEMRKIRMEEKRAAEAVGEGWTGASGEVQTALG